MSRTGELPVAYYNIKTCSQCGQVKPSASFYTDRAKKDGLSSRCRDCAKTAASEWQAAHRAEATTRQRTWVIEHPEARRAYGRRSHARARRTVLDHYGHTCACCGSADRLTIDHVNGDGQEHRAQIGRDPGKMYRWLIRHGFPEGFQTLCLPCNQSKGTGPQCRLDHRKAA